MNVYVLNAKRPGVTISLHVGSNGTTDYFKPEVLQATDYYAKGIVTHIAAPLMGVSTQGILFFTKYG